MHFFQPVDFRQCYYHKINIVDRVEFLQVHLKLQLLCRMYDVGQGILVGPIALHAGGLVIWELMLLVVVADYGVLQHERVCCFNCQLYVFVD